MNEKTAYIFALELGRFCAHCMGLMIAAVMLFVGMIGMWDVALKVGVIPLLVILMIDVLARRQEDRLRMVVCKA
ncbi:hypothetical protein HKW98_06205 [Stutzerimonas urumqiensis]|uniref:hypothetical protein n=1 Tax=Stutzerimonas urumqiensis TaxID=638269 RepID=UPI000EB3EAC7|nr:hypothetical protein [Stutzerimonas urumqiensis]